MFFFPAGDGQVDFEEFVTLLGPKLTAAGMPDKFNGTDFDSVFWKVRECKNPKSRFANMISHTQTTVI